MRLTTTFLLVAVSAISGCKMGMRQSADNGCAATCTTTVGYAKAGCAENGCTTGACTTGGCTTGACTTGACTTGSAKTSCSATCVPGNYGCVSGASGCTTSCGACGDTISQAKAAAATKTTEVVAQPTKPFATSEIQPTNATTPVEEPTVEPAVLQPQTSIYRHAEDYRWLVGQLQRVHTPGTEWKLRYSSLDEHDVWGGSMVLARDARLDNFEDGQLVYVEGAILAERPSAYLAGPLYRVNVIRPVTEQDLIAPAGR